MILNVCIWQVDSLVANVVFFGLIGLAIGSRIRVTVDPTLTL